jgi:uncharacterized protein (DUF2267 family)
VSTFDHTVEKADLWIREMMRELGTQDPRQAYHALAASLQTLRDRLPVDEAAQLGPQLPLLVRGLFFEGWHPASTPVHIRRPEDLITRRDREQRQPGRHPGTTRTHTRAEGQEGADRRRLPGTGNALGREREDLNRQILSEMRRAEKKTRLRAEWTSGGVTESFFDCVPKGTKS